MNVIQSSGVVGSIASSAFLRSLGKHRKHVPFGSTASALGDVFSFWVGIASSDRFFLSKSLQLGSMYFFYVFHAYVSVHVLSHVLISIFSP